MESPSFDATKQERRMIIEIARRANAKALAAGIEYPILDAEMDITAAHANGCPLNLEKLLASDEITFSHDVFGIRQHLNRETGKIEDCFLPRCSRHEAA